VGYSALQRFSFFECVRETIHERIFTGDALRKHGVQDDFGA
jgi:hypothetical protein